MIALLILEVFFGASTQMYTWTTREDGAIVTRDTVTGAESVLTLTGANAAELESIEARWGDLCRRIGDRHGLPDGWLQAMIFRESHKGDPRSRNPEKLPGPEDDGVGLMQITSSALKAGYSDKELEDPEINVEIGASYIASLVKRYGRDFPRISAAYNAGSVHAPFKGAENPWGMHCTPGHITAEVSALNYYVQRPLSESDRNAALAVLHDSFEQFARHDFERGMTEPPADGGIV